MTIDSQDDLWGGAPEESANSEAPGVADIFGELADPDAKVSPEPLTPKGTAANASAAGLPDGFHTSLPAAPASAKAQTDGYVVLARKYRPQTFDDIVGQEGVQTALRGAIATGQISHAYLFSGPRGTGKTSTARILAKALNCQDNGPRADPCGRCSSCRSITAGSSLDVIEIDAASNTGVDNIRDLKSGIVLAPFSRFKVYIVDEVHMLSNQAFNALLKTLEEPPPQVIFVLATTELHKVPETIISRCSTFMFRRFSLAELKGQLGHILDIEIAGRGISVSPEDREGILELIARNAEGGMRDAQVTLDQVLVLSKGTMDFESVRRFLGMADNEALDRFVTGLHNRDSKGLLELIEVVVSQGQDLELFVKSLSEHMRDLLLVRCAGRDTTLINVSQDRALQLEATANSVSPAFLVSAIEQFMKVTGEMKLSGQPRIVLELAVLKLTLVDSSASLESILRRLDFLEKGSGTQGGVGDGGTQQPSSNRAVEQAPVVPKPVASRPASVDPAADSYDQRPPNPEHARKLEEVKASGERVQEAGPADIQPVDPRGEASAPADIAGLSAEQMGQAIVEKLRTESPMLYMSFEKIYCGQEFDGRVITLLVCSTPKMALSQFMRPQNTEILTNIAKSLYGSAVILKLQVQEGGRVQPAKEDIPKIQAPPAVTSSAPPPEADAFTGTEEPETFSPEAIDSELDMGAPVIYYPQEIREKAMVEVKPAQFRELLSSDSQMRDFVDKVKAAFGIEDKCLRFLRSTLT